MTGDERGRKTMENWPQTNGHKGLNMMAEHGLTGDIPGT